jgi:signal transduction histidine kinase
MGSLAPQLAAQGIRTRLNVPADQTITADRDMLRRAVLNLLLNALDVMPDGGELAVSATAGPVDLSIEVADSGPGLSLEARQRAFEPFFTTKSNGTGLGLAIVERIATAHGGDIVASDGPLGGAAFTIRIPARRQEAA